MSFKRFKQLRSDKLLTQAQAAEILGVEDKTIRNWESGHSTPNTLTRSKIVDVFFGGDVHKFNDYFSDSAESTLESWDFSVEENMISAAVRNGTLRLAFSHPLRQLFNPQKSDSVGRAVCSILGSLRIASAESVSYILGELATLIYSSSDVQTGSETDRLLNDLNSRLVRFTANTDVTESGHNEIIEAITALQHFEDASSPQKRLDIFQCCFFSVSNNAKALSRDTNFTYALSDIFIPLTGGATYSAGDRRHLFYSLYNCAKML